MNTLAQSVFNIRSRVALPQVHAKIIEWNNILMNLLDPSEYESFFGSISWNSNDSDIVDVSMDFWVFEWVRVAIESSDISFVYPVGSEAVRLFLWVISLHSDRFQKTNPRWAFSALWALYEKYCDHTNIHGSTEYIWFLWVLVSCAGIATHFPEGDIVAQKLRELLVPYLWEIFPGTPSSILESSPVDFWSTVFDGRGELIHTLRHYQSPEWSIDSTWSQAYRYGDTITVALNNLSKFYSKTGAYDRALAAAQIGYEVAHRLYADVALFHVAITKIMTMIHMRRGRNPETTLLVSYAKRVHSRLIEIYGAESEIGKVIAEEWNTRLRIIEIRLLSERVAHWDLSNLTKLMNERDQLLWKWLGELSIEDQAILVQTQVVLLIAIDRLFRDQEGLSIALAKNPEAIVYIINNGKKVHTLGLDIQKYAQTENRWLLLWSMVSLFCHLTKTIISDASTPPIDRKLLELKNTMFDIYRTIQGIVGGNLEYLKCQWFYPSFISAAREVHSSISENPGINEVATLEYLEANSLTDVFHTQETWTKMIKEVLYMWWDVWWHNIFDSLYWWRVLERTHTGPIIPIDKLTNDSLEACTTGTLFIMFPDETWCSVVQSAVGSYTIRFLLENGTMDRLPEFGGICHWIYGEDNEFHFDEIVCKYPKDTELCERQLWQIHGKIQPDRSDIRYDANEILEWNLLYRDTFGTIYNHGRNSRWEQVFIVKTRQGEWDFRCEINTYYENGRYTVYIGSMLNSQGGHNLRNILNWLAKIVNTLDWSDLDFQIDLTRDTAHNERSARMTSWDFLKAFNNWSRCLTPISTFYHDSFFHDFFHKSEESLSVI